MGSFMKVLLDTCAFIWLCCEPDKFSPVTRELFQKEPSIVLYLSDASVLEIAIKNATGKLHLPESSSEWVRKQIEIWDICALPLSHKELFLSAELPWHHRDPFDRLIIATAINHKLPVITSDRIFMNYGVELIS
jgi:PIN domain nuclease of toxin-antitoxin system